MSKAQKRKGAKARSKVKKLSKPARSKAAAKPVGKAKPKREQVKKAARAIASAAEAVAVEVIEQPAPGVLRCDGSRGDGGTSSELNRKRAEPERAGEAVGLPFPLTLSPLLGAILGGAIGFWVGIGTDIRCCFATAPTSD